MATAESIVRGTLAMATVEETAAEEMDGEVEAGAAEVSGFTAGAVGVAERRAAATKIMSKGGAGNAT